nr:sugar ABC transporter ATP-binding protein [uncultured Marvinbryantia sp.]
MLKLEHITKTYPGVKALNDVSLEFEQGEVHALLGENGAGKSTLIKIIAGAIAPDAGGKIIFDDREYPQMTPALSAQNGVAVIYQDVNLVVNMTVAENIFMGRKMGKGYSKKRLNKLARELFDEYGFDLDPGMRVIQLSPAMQQMVEIARAISNDARIMIMDEPTAPLASKEVDLLFDIIRKLRKKGVTVIYISHRMEEVFEITERISVLRDGAYVKTIRTKDTNRQELVNLMVGRELKETFPERKSGAGEVVLEARNLTGNSVEQIGFQLHKGEILGFAGLVGSGRSETMEVLCGAKKLEGGEIILHGKRVKIKSPADAIRLGIGWIPEDRKEQGVILHNTVLFNTSLSCMDKLTTFGFINKKKNEEMAEKYRADLQIKVPHIRQMVLNLSGGNQQKVVLAKTLAADPDIIIFDEPTKGIDVGAKQEIYNLMNRLAENGKAIIMVSSDMEEILGMSDRIIVLYEGRCAGELSRAEFSQETILRLASGMQREEAKANGK